MDGDEGINLGDIENEIKKTADENSYLRNKNLGLQDQVESNFMPKADPNVIEFKLSPDELLEKIEHYLRGDILKTRTNVNGEVESYFSPPTKKITVSLYQNKNTKLVYVVDQHPEKETDDKTQDDTLNWEILSVIEGEGEEAQEIIIEDNYKGFLMKELKKGIEGKNKKFNFQGYAAKEIIDKSRIILNEYGVAEIMNDLSMQISKETFLSFYKEERINEILATYGDELNKFMLVNGKLMGLDTEYKKTKYPKMVVVILYAIESSYRRALSGNENRGTREGILITQHQPQGGNMMPMQTQKKKWNPFDKTSW